MSSGNRDVSGIENDPLIMVTMSLVGRQVEVHLRDASVYLGILVTANPRDGYSIVLKSARKLKAGKRESNIAMSELIDTLVIRPGELVEVFAQGGGRPSDNSIKALEAQTSDTDVDNVKIADPLRTSMENKNQSALSSAQAISLEAPPATANKIAKESKLNPEAKEFIPSFMKPLTANLMAPPMDYIPNNCWPIDVPAPGPEIALSHLGSYSSVPMKAMPYKDLADGNMGSAHFPQPIVGPIGSWAPPIRVSDQYGIQAGPGMYPNPQSVMVGPQGQLLPLHPASQEMVPGPMALPPPFIYPPPAPHPVLLSKHQGPGLGQEIQLFGQPPYPMPYQLPPLQPPFPTSQYFPFNGHPNSRFL